MLEGEGHGRGGGGGCSLQSGEIRAKLGKIREWGEGGSASSETTGNDELASKFYCWTTEMRCLGLFISLVNCLSFEKAN